MWGEVNRRTEKALLVHISFYEKKGRLIGEGVSWASGGGGTISNSAIYPLSFGG
jgi:hypothetical protein